METKRLITFLIAVVGLSVVWQFLFPQAPPPKPLKKSVDSKSLSQKHKQTDTKNTHTTASSRPIAKATTQPSSQPSLPMEKISKEEKSLEGKDYSLKVSNQGGGISKMLLKNFYEGDIKKKIKLDLIGGPRSLTPPFVESLQDSNLADHESIPYQFVASKEKNTFRMVGKVPSKQGGYVQVEKKYQFTEDKTSFLVTLKITNKTQHSISNKISLVLRDQEDPKNITPGGLMQQANIFDVVCRKATESRPERINYPDIDKKKTVAGNIKYIGLDRQYFLMALIPKWSAKDSSLGCFFSNDSKGNVVLSVQNNGVQVASHGSVEISYTGFLGPKYYQVLKKVGGQLDSAIDFGFFAALSKPLLIFMTMLYGWLGMIGLGNWGLAIIVLTLLVKLLVFPFTQKSMKSMAHMQALKPEMDKLKAKYGDDKESMQRETMALYAKYGINPLGGCLPMLIQMPVWIGLYQMLFHAVELYQKTFIPGWIDNLSVRDPYFVLPVLMGISMFYQQKMTPQTSMDETQAKIMGYAMPIVFTALMFFLPSSLTLYIFVNTIVGVAHHVYMHKNPPKIEEGKNKKQGGIMAKLQQAMDQAEKAKKSGK